jgi:hypothetical protein
VHWCDETSHFEILGKTVAKILAETLAVFLVLHSRTSRPRTFSMPPPPLQVNLHDFSQRVNGWERTVGGKLHRGEIQVLHNEMQRDSLPAADLASIMSI